MSSPPPPEGADPESGLLRALFEAMPQLGWTARADGYIDHYNARWYAYTGARPADMEGWGWTSVHDPEELPRVLERWRRSIATGQPFEMEFRLRRHDGAMRWFLTRVEPMRGDDGRVLRWVGINTDIHDQKMAQEAVREARASAERERERFRRLFEQAPLPILFYEGAEHHCVLANPRARALLGGREIVGKRLLDALPELADQPAARTMEEVFRTGVRVEETEPQPVQIQSAAGELEERQFRTTWEPLLGPEGDVEGILTIGVELTEQVRLRRAIEASEERAVSANRAKDEFLAMLGHELRNPLAPIRTALELMNLSLEEGAVRRERDIIDRHLGHLVRMVDDLLDVARITGGKLTLHREPLDLARVLEEAIETASPLLEARGHRFTVTAPAETFAVDADPDRIAQVFSNLLINAAKYTPDDGHVEVWATAGDGQVSVSIRDDGLGLSPELRSRLFRPFEQNPQSIARSNGGLGLGLAIAKNIVEQHGGALSAESEGVGRGSTFTVRLPLIDPEALEAHRRALRERRRSDREMGVVRRRRVLVVDDNEDAAELLGERLMKRGYEVATAHDGARALEVAAAFRPQVCVLDIGLPVMDGYELARRLRAQLDPTPRFIALTGYGRDDDKAAAREAGFDVHFTKPVRFQRLVAALEESE